MKKSTIITTGICSLMMLLCVDAKAQKFPDLDKSPMDAAWFPTDYKDSNKNLTLMVFQHYFKPKRYDF